MNLRQRIRKCKINCSPWKFYRGEIRSLPIISQCLFSRIGIPWDVLEMELKSEGFLLETEDLWDALSDKNRMMLDINNIEKEEVPWDDSWTEEDFEFYYKNL